MEKIELFKNRLKQALDQKQMKQAELSKKTKIDAGNITHYLNGEYEPKLKKLKILANALEVDPLWLMGYDVPISYKLSNKERIIASLDTLSESQLEKLEKLILLILEEK